jgi:diacylglycerol kinase family enzyme
MNPIKKLAIVFNPVGGSASEEKRNELAGYFQSQGIDVAFCATTPEPGSATTLAKSAVDGGAEVVVAFGGDGTACQVAEALRGSTVPMAVYPGGTGNLFARSFYSDPTPSQFAEMILKGKPQPVDLITANYKDLEGKDQSRLFMVGFGLGKVSDAISTASPFFKRIFGRLVYVVKVALACLLPGARRFQLSFHDQKSSEDAAALFALNVTPPVMATMSRGCNASDGMMDVVIFRGKNAWHLISVAFWLALGRPERSRHYCRFRTNELTINSGKSMLPNIDGDPGSYTKEITLKVLPGAVQMVLS